MGAERGEGSTRYGRKHGPFGDSRNKDIESKDSRLIAARANEMETPVLPLANSEVILRTKVICLCTTSVVSIMDVAYGRLLRLQYNDTTIMPPELGLLATFIFAEFESEASASKRAVLKPKTHASVHSTNKFRL